MRPAMWRFNILKFASCRSIFLWSSLQFNHLFSIFIEKIPTFLRVWFIYGMKIFIIYHKSMPVAQSNKLSNDCKRKLVINYHSLPQRRFTRSKNMLLSRPKLTEASLLAEGLFMFNRIATRTVPFYCYRHFQSLYSSLYI